MFRSYQIILRELSWLVVKLHTAAYFYTIQKCFYLVCRSICFCIPDSHLHRVHETATYRCDDTRYCVMQF